MQYRKGIRSSPCSKKGRVVSEGLTCSRDKQSLFSSAGQYWMERIRSFLNWSCAVCLSDGYAPILPEFNVVTGQTRFQIRERNVFVWDVAIKVLSSDQPAAEFPLMSTWPQTQTKSISIPSRIKSEYSFWISVRLGWSNFSSVQDGIYALGKAYMRSTQSFRSFSNVALETVLMFV